MNLERRKATLAAAAVLGGSFLAGVLRPGTLLAAWNQQAFDANNLQDALGALRIANPAQSGDVLIDAPDIAENSRFVPVQITSGIPGTQSIAIFVDRNPFPHIARFDFAPGTLAFVALRLRIAETSPVRVVVRAGNSYYVAMKEVRVTVGGCSDTSGPATAPVATKVEAIKILAKLEGGVANVRALLSHPMENGLHKDATGRLIPEHFIQTLDVKLNGKAVVEAQIGRSVSTNPLFAFKVPGARAGDRFTLTWRDNKGLARSDEIAVTG